MKNGQFSLVNPLSAMRIYICATFPLIKRDAHIYMRIMFSDFKQALKYFRTVSNFPYICIWLITKYLPRLNNCVTSMKYCEQTDSTKETVDAHFSRK